MSTVIGAVGAGATAIGSGATTAIVASVWPQAASNAVMAQHAMTFLRSLMRRSAMSSDMVVVFVGCPKFHVSGTN
jgi:hypothetical protein